MGAAELSDRVVAVVGEHPLVEPAGATGRLLVGAAVRATATGSRGIEVVGELVEQQPPQALRRTGVARVQGALDDLGHVQQREHGSVGVGDVPCQHGALGGGERLDDVGGHVGSGTGMDGGPAYEPGVMLR